jgi:hypothetical protein
LRHTPKIKCKKSLRNTKKNFGIAKTVLRILLQRPHTFAL